MVASYLSTKCGVHLILFTGVFSLPNANLSRVCLLCALPLPCTYMAIADDSFKGVAIISSSCSTLYFILVCKRVGLYVHVYFNIPCVLLRNVRADLLAINSSVHRPDMPQSKTILTIDERGSNIARNSVFDRHLSTGGR